MRPTADKVRKSIFDMLQGEVEGKSVLDLFSGTGALGFEALSGGARQVTFIESDKDQARKIKENIQKLGVERQSTVWPADALKAVQDLSAQGRQFDLIFLDPPYAGGWGQKTLAALARASLAGKNTLIFFECDKKERSEEVIGRLRRIKQKKHGGTCLHIYRAEEENV